MKRILKISLGLALIWCTSLAILAQHNTTAKTIKIGWYHSALFQEGMSDSVPKSGYSYDYIHKVADYNGWTYQYVYGEWTELFSKLEKGEIDVLAGVSKTEERMGKILYPHDIMGKEHYVLYQHANHKTMNVMHLSTFEGKKIGTIRNNLMSTRLEQWLKDNPCGAEIIYYDSFEERDQDFDDGKLDALITTDNGILLSSQYDAIARVGADEYYLAVTKGRHDLLDDLNHAQDHIDDINPYYLNNLEYKAYGATMAKSRLSDIEGEWLDAHRVMVVGYLEHYIPYCDTDDKGHAYGLITDVMEAMLDKLNISERLKVTYKGYTDGEEMIKALKNGEIDAAFPVGGELWQLEQKGIKASNDVVTSHVNLVYKGTYSQEKIRTIAVTKGNTMMRDYLVAAYPKAKVLEYSSIQDCLDAVLAGKADATTINGLRIDIIKKNRKYHNLSVMRMEKTSGRCLGVSNQNTGLQLMLNRGLNLIGSDFGNNVSYNYMDNLYHVTISDFFANHLVLFFGIIMVFFGTIIFAVLRARHRDKAFLSMEEEKNHELEEHQAQLEELTAEQESQIEEIQILNRELERHYAIAQAASRRYFCIYSIDLETDTFYEIFSQPHMTAVLGGEGVASLALDKAWRMLVIADDQPIMEAFHDMTRWKDYLKDRDYYSCEYSGIQKGWSRAILFAAQRDNDGMVTQVVYTLEQIQEQKETEEALRKANESLIQLSEEAKAASQAKTSFLFNMSHDIRTPMNAIIGFTNLLRKHQKDSKRRNDYLDKIERSSAVLLSIINNVLEMARIEKGTIELVEEPMLAQDFNETLQTIFREIMKQKGLTFTCTAEVKHNKVCIDPTKLREVFYNILSNAYKYTEKGSVTMHLKEIPSTREGYALYQTTITDTGMGMSEDFLPHLFDEFSRENNTTDNKIEGTGLGMPIVKRLVELMQGTIEVKSQKGVGTTFIVTLPHKIADDVEMVELSTEEINPEKFQGKRILLAEDNDLNAEIAMEILGEVGFVLERAEDGNQCVEMIKKAEPDYYDIILMDVQMPGMNGYESTRVIREMSDPRKASIIILAMTANAFEEDSRRSLEAGMNGHLVKPFDVPDLLKTLSSILKH